MRKVIDYSKGVEYARNGDLLALRDEVSIRRQIRFVSVSLTQSEIEAQLTKEQLENILHVYSSEGYGNIKARTHSGYNPKEILELKQIAESGDYMNFFESLVALSYVGDHQPTSKLSSIYGLGSSNDSALTTNRRIARK